MPSPLLLTCTCRPEQGPSEDAQRPAKKQSVVTRSISNQELLCDHGKVDPCKTSAYKIVTQGVWNQFLQVLPVMSTPRQS